MVSRHKPRSRIFIPFWFLAQGRSRPDFFFLSLDSSQKLTKTVKRITVLNVNFASLITLYTLRKKSKQIKILRFFPRKLIKYQTQIYRIVFQSKFLESDNFYFFGFWLKTSQLFFQAMPARAVCKKVIRTYSSDKNIHLHVLIL